MSGFSEVDESWLREYEAIPLDEFEAVSEEEMAEIDAELSRDKEEQQVNWHRRLTLLLWKGEDEVFGDSIGDWPVPVFCDLPEANGLCLHPL